MTLITLRVITGGRAALPNDSDLVDRMAEDLRRIGLPASEREAVRALMALPYPWQAVARLAAEALFQARLRAAREHMAVRQ